MAAPEALRGHVLHSRGLIISPAEPVGAREEEWWEGGGGEEGACEPQ